MASKKLKNIDKPIEVPQPKNLPSVNSPIYRLPSDYGNNIGRLTQRTNLFEPCEYDLYEVARVEDVESYVRQAFKKKIGLFLKEGYAYVSNDPKISRYLSIRFKQIAQVSSIPHDELIRKIVTSFVKKSNAFLIKVRDEKSSGGKLRIDGNGKEIKPVAAYFIAPAETMEIETNGSGKPVRYRQRLPNGIMKEFHPDDVVHFTFDRKDGFLFGTPTLTPVIDDIKALRKIEENIELLIYKHLFPLFQYTVGTEEAPATINENGDKEIDVVRRELEYLPSEGAIVTSERHKISAIGAENSALRAEKYLEHFQRRVFAGLGLSSVDFGLAETVNRSTSDNLSRALIDDVKDMQASFEAQFNEFIIKELLLESTFNINIFLEEQLAEIEFREIDLDKQVKMENHYVDLFTKNGLTYDETRQAIGRDVIEIPTDGRTNNPAGYPQWFKTYWKLFDEPANLIRASDEPYSHIAEAVAESAAISVTPENVAAAQSNSERATKAEASAKKKVATKDSLTTSIYKELTDYYLDYLVSNNKYDKLETLTLFQTFKTKIVEHVNAQAVSAFVQAYGTVKDSDIAYLIIKRKEIRSRVEKSITKFMKDLSATIDKRQNIDVPIDSSVPNVTISNVRIVFDTMSHRIDLITNFEKKKASHLGSIAKMDVGTEIVIQKDSCKDCQSYTNFVYTKTLSDFDNIPPFHPGCNCGLKA